MWVEIIEFLGVSAIIIAAIAWLARKIVVHILSKNIAVDILSKKSIDLKNNFKLNPYEVLWLK